MASIVVKNLKIQLQSGTTNTYFASWDFEGARSGSTQKIETTIRPGDYVTIKPTATKYYNGVTIPSWVKGNKWQVVQITENGKRVVLGKDLKGNFNIQSPIHVDNLISDRTESSSTQIISMLYFDHYSVSWSYDTGDGVWFSGGSSDVKEKNALYNAPSNANRIRVTVKPVSTTYRLANSNTDIPRWNGSSVSAVHQLAGDPPEKPSTPTVSIDNYKLTASIENISDPRTDKIIFELYKGVDSYQEIWATVYSCMASVVFNVEAGGEYRVRCRSVNVYNKTNIKSDWSDFSSALTTIPEAPTGFISLRATSETSVYIELAAISGATSYDIQYTTGNDNLYWSNPTSISGIESLQYEKTGLESGQEYFFRVRAVNSKGSSKWSGVSSIVIGKTPSAPTTWSSTTTAITGESLTLYWVHNSEDNSSQTYAEIYFWIYDNNEYYSKTVTVEGDTSSYSIDTSSFTEGSYIQWNVRTAGVTKNYGNWSIKRKIDIYAPAVLSVDIIKHCGGNSLVNDTLNEFPFDIVATPGPESQIPISYHFVIKADQTYSTTNQSGEEEIITSGSEVYSKYYDTSTTELMVMMTPSDVNLENGISYTVTCTVSMDSGLTVESSKSFTVEWLYDETYSLDVEIAIDERSYCAYLRPFCFDYDGTLSTDITLSIYRKEFDGTFCELAKDIDNNSNVYILDPHPSLDYARYRIIAKSETTGKITYYDPPGFPVECKSVIIQWDDVWSNFNTLNNDVMEERPSNGSFLNLKYNIDVSDDNSMDVSLVEYIGRKYPVSYYGTQIGSTSTWNMEIEKDDKETLYALRRLAIWKGDVYVREPSGSGYWANIKVSFNQKHCALTIPVSFSITRVEGGV